MRRIPDKYFETKTLIYQSELNHMAAWAEECPNLETGGELFGFWTHSGFPVVQVAIGPGPNSRHELMSFHQDGEFLKSIGESLNREHGLQHIGEWHSHHRMELNIPSPGDTTTMVQALEQNDLSKFLLCIANIYPVIDSKKKMQTRTLIKERLIIKIGCFLYTKSHSTYQSGAWVVFPGKSPFVAKLNSQYSQRGLKIPTNKRKPDVNETTLDSQRFEGIRPIEVSESQWYSKHDGRESLKDIYRELNKFKNCQMFRGDSERVYFILEHNHETCLIAFPDDFPNSWAKLRFHESTIHLDDCKDGQSISKRIESALNDYGKKKW
jgi:hypothetical protein